MRMSIDDGRCLGHTMCVVAAPSLVDIDPDTGHAFVLRAEVPADEEEAARMAEAGCPERAVRVTTGG
jgi:ferredoxin